MKSTIILANLEFEVIVECFIGYDPGVTSGPPEDCYPPEGPTIEWHVDPDHPIAEFIQEAIDNNTDWQEHVETQLCEIYTMEPDYD